MSERKIPLKVVKFGELLGIDLSIVMKTYNFTWYMCEAECSVNFDVNVTKLPWFDDSSSIV